MGALQDQALAGDRERVSELAEDIREHTGAAREALTGPHWTIASKLPWLGENVTAVQTVSVAVDDLANNALGDLVDAIEVVDPANLAPDNGRIDIAPIAEVAPKVVAANETVQASAGALEEIDTESLVGQVATAVEQLSGQVDEIASLTGTASRAVQLIPPMMGIDEPREYLLLVQNNAEPRATGGIPGAVILLRAEEGAIEIVDQRDAGAFGPYGENDPVLQLRPAERSLYGTQLGRFMADVTFTPDFPRSAELAREMWRREFGTEVDGVLSVDPVALGALLGPTGAVTLPTGHELTADTAAQILLNQVYLDIEDPAQQDLFFEAAASAIFDRVLSGAGDPTEVIGVLDEVAAEGRLMVWSVDAGEQRLLSETNLSGALRGHYRDAPIVGVYVNDLSAAKIGYYQHVSAKVQAVGCGPGGPQNLHVSVAVRSQVPPNYSEMPPYLIGDGSPIAVGDMRSQIVLYAPRGGQITNFVASDGQTAGTPAVHDGLSAVSTRVTLSPGETRTLDYDVRLQEPLAVDPIVRVTPGPADGQFTASTSPCA
ncbi:DUF4012 domain-containing protein [Georgenia halophila]|uniref:DUF4012 domain-containing protein n=1 Tax=Georgenia halophila TaxID=620889 RepID=UPI0031EA6F72